MRVCYVQNGDDDDFDDFDDDGKGGEGGGEEEEEESEAVGDVLERGVDDGGDVLR